MGHSWPATAREHGRTVDDHRNNSWLVLLLLQAAFESRLLQPYMLMGVSTDLLVQDSSALAGPGEQLSFLQLQVCWPAKLHSTSRCHNMPTRLCHQSSPCTPPYIFKGI